MNITKIFLAVVLALSFLMLPVFVQGETVDTTVTWCIDIPCEAPTIATGIADNITSNSATLHGNLLGLGGDSEVNVSFEYGKSTSLGLETPNTTLTETGIFNITVLDLESDVDYYYRAKADGTSIGYGIIRTFRTEGVGLTQAEIELIFIIVLFALALFLILLGILLDVPLIWVFSGIIFGVMAFWVYDNIEGNLRIYGTVLLTGLSLVFIGIGAALSVGSD